jgi:hypothetical protein
MRGRIALYKPMSISPAIKDLMRGAAVQELRATAQAQGMRTCARPGSPACSKRPPPSTRCCA